MEWAPDFDIKTLVINETWKPIIESLYKDESFEDINLTLQEDCQHVSIYPSPYNLYKAFNTTPFDKVRVVILGQDPYHGKDLNIIQAMGLSFSVPEGVTIPSSLRNIYSNLLKFKHIKKMPQTGNIEKWAQQGCLLLNTALTVKEAKPNSHSLLWHDFTSNIISQLSNQKTNLIFVLWGSSSANKEHLIDEKKHKIIISSHPSGLSYMKKLKNHPSFNEFDHFGEINKYLISISNEPPIDWT